MTFSCKMHMNKPIKILIGAAALITAGVAVGTAITPLQTTITVTEDDLSPCGKGVFSHRRYLRIDFRRDTWRQDPSARWESTAWRPPGLSRITSLSLKSAEMPRCRLLRKIEIVNLTEIGAGRFHFIIEPSGSIWDLLKFASRKYETLCTNF